MTSFRLFRSLALSSKLSNRELDYMVIVIPSACHSGPWATQPDGDIATKL